MLSGRLGPYTLLRQIAVGGMAEIYLAAPGDGSTAARVAIKVIHQQNASDPDFVRMLIDEARLATQLDHPNIVKTYDLGKEGDQYYIVMEYIDGADLFKVQQRGAVRRQTFPIALGAFIARQVARGLDFAHRLKDSQSRPLYIVHRDISPQNILVSFDGDVKITDFGIAKAAHRAEQTQAGIIKGKYYYMSPEQAAGRLIDARTDVFAAGILLYEMLIGEMLYYDDDIDKLLAMVRKADILPPSRRRSDIPPALEAICMKALGKKPDDRFQTAAEYGAALDDFLRAFAPDYGAAELGAFVTRIIDGPKGHGDQRRPAAAPVPMREAASADEHSPTVGLSNDQLDRLGIRDENSLIFAPLEKLEALLKAAGAASGADSGASRPMGVAKGEIRRGTDSNMQTRRRMLDNKMVIDPQLLGPPIAEPATSAATPKRTVSAKGRQADWSEESTNPAWKQERAAAKRQSRHPARPTPFGTAGDEGLDRPTVSTEVAPALLSSIGSPEDQAHESPTARRPAEAARLARVSMAIPVLDPAAYQNESRRPTRPQRPSPTRHSNPPAPPASQSADGQRPLVFELMAAPAPVDLVISDDGFAQIAQSQKPSDSEPSVVPSVELEQSDGDFAAQPSVAPEGSAVELDAISSESTHYNLPKTPERPSSPSLYERPSASSLALPVVGARSRLSYVLAGLGAAVISAVVTWQLMTRQAGLPSQPQAEPAGDGGPVLLMYEVPESEPPPAPLLTTDPPIPAASGAPAAAASGPRNPAGQPDETGELELNSTPPGAAVYLNKELVGTTPLRVPGLPLSSDVKIELKLDGFAKTRKRIKWKGEKQLSVTVKLKPGDAASPDGADPPAAKAPGEGPPTTSSPP